MNFGINPKTHQGNVVRKMCTKFEPNLTIRNGENRCRRKALEERKKERKKERNHWAKSGKAPSTITLEPEGIFHYGQRLWVGLM